MGRDRCAADIGACDDGTMREAVLRLGGLLGWEPGEVIAFTEGLTGCTWEHCTSAEFAQVVDEFQALVQAIEAKASRRAVRERARNAAALSGECDAACD
jgi:hypothetical protein